MSTERIEAEEETRSNQTYKGTLRQYTRHIPEVTHFPHRLHDVPPFNHRHLDREHVANYRLLELHPGGRLLQVDDGTCGQTQEGRGQPGMRAAQS